MGDKTKRSITQSLKNSISKLSDKALNLISPCRCMCCGFNVCKDELPVCVDCMKDFYDLLYSKCDVCGLVADDCTCNSGSPVFLFWYRSRLSHKIIGNIKNNADIRYARFLAELLVGRHNLKHRLKYDCITYVPRRKKGIRIAGYDQAKLIAKEVSAILDIECIPTLKRFGKQEQKLLSASQRKKAIKNRYAVINENIMVEGEPLRRVLLVDDIYTTGATIKGCSDLLRKAGVRQVVSLVMARTQRRG